MAISLKEIIDGMEMNGFDMRVFYSRKNNKLVFFNDHFDDEEDEETFDEDDLVALPDSYDIHEYRMMEEFIETVEDTEDYNSLIISIQGKGAFRRFKDMCINLGLIDKWYQFRDEAYKKIAIEWCERNDIEYVI